MSFKFGNFTHIISALFVLTIIVFWRVGISGYVQWDDNVFISDNVLLREPFWNFLRQIFTHYFFGDYIPLTLMSFWVEFQIWGAQPEPQHIFNLILHLLNISLLFSYLMKLSLSRGAALFITAVFALHPLQAEVVMWISERKSLLAVFFSLLAMHSAQKISPDKIGGLGWAGYFLFFTLSLLSKSTALFLPILLMASDRLLFKNSWIESLKKHLLPLGLALIWGILRVLAYTNSVQNSSMVAFNAERLWSLPVQIFSALGFYLEKFFVPLHLSIIYPPYSTLQNYFWPTFAILFFLAAGFFAYKKKDPRILYFLILVILFLLPVIQIVPRINFVSDRYMYFPVIGLAGILAILIPSALRSIKVAVPVILVLSFICYQRTQVWLSDLTLWTDTVEKNPHSGLAQNNLGLALLKENKVEAAISHFEIGTQVGLREGTAHLAFHNLGLTYSSNERPSLKNLAKAETYYLESIRTSPKDSAPSRLNLGLLYAETHRMSDAVQVLSDLENDLASRSDQQNLSLLTLTRKILSSLKK